MKAEEKKKINTYKETATKQYLYVAQLENGAILGVLGDSAQSFDGKTYYHVGKINGDMLETVGWSCDIDRAIVLE